ncbi:iron-containing alcohol dehydrogenase [Coriobacterium glomerans PW2]|uniref:Iron-containing alcohol dehydrogenase n=1 Tax=Coriobacterium glomerans (strain ATCC 49209 / DSM 20642 / JCM 10262 / PW2) TaxID=700015 RepID=F2N7F4_CORGP|nr:iron-containing alcohol dehydrogenase [Coriobacterium glomerans]AEB06770.1 iron-containing alcohol dehydrogenase [Coriobacterium glomerans PW2]
MNDFTFYSPTRFVFGRGAVDRVGRELAADGRRRALIVYGRGSVARTGTLQRVRSSLAAAGIEAAELGGVRPNPEIGSVRQGVRIAREMRSDIILALGGGSAIDAAKAIALATPYEGDAWDFFAKRAQPAAPLPVAVVLTIPASGSEASNSSVVSNDAEHLKSGINTDLIRPVCAIMDPELTFTLPPYQTAAGVCDMICHVMERFFSGEPAVTVTDGIGCSLIRSAIQMGPRVMADPLDYDARANLMWISTLAHNGLAGLGMGVAGKRDGDWSAHALEHELSALDTSITHGAGLAVIFPAWMRHVWSAHPERFLTFGKEIFDIEPVEENPLAAKDAIECSIDELQNFFVSLGMPRTLAELGLVEDDIELLLPGLLANRGERFGTFMSLTLDDARSIYLSALR